MTDALPRLQRPGSEVIETDDAIGRLGDDRRGRSFSLFSFLFPDMHIWGLGPSSNFPVVSGGMNNSGGMGKQTPECNF